MVVKADILLIGIVFFFCANVFAQQEYSNAVQITTEYEQENNYLIFNAYNQDFCDYVVYLKCGNDIRYLTARPGKSEIYRVKNTYNIYYQYAMYRGAIDKKPNIDFTYSLPITKGDSLVMYANVFSDGYRMDFTSFADNLYAIRDGIVCNDDVTDFTAKGHEYFNESRFFKKLTVYHADGSFGEYIFVGQPLVNKGDHVKMGQSIATLRKDEVNKFSLDVYFLDKNKVYDLSIGNKHSHFRPFFQTINEGKQRLEEEKIYYCERNNEMLMQDMSKREQKKFQKTN